MSENSQKKVRFAKAIETPRQREPEKIWLDGDQWYLTIEEGRFVITHDREQLARFCGPEILLQTTLLSYGDKTNDGVLVKTAAVPWFEILKGVLNSQTHR